MPDCNAMDACPSISSSVAHLVNRLLWPESGGERAMNAGCGPSCCAWSASYDRAGVWRRIRSGYCQLTLDGHGERFLEPWSRWGIVVDGVYGALLRWERRTAANVSSSSAIELRAQWPTPAALDSGSGRLNRSASPGATPRPTLAWMARKAQWPTPPTRDAQAESVQGGRRHYRRYHSMMLAAAASLWPTPRAEKTEGTASAGYSPTLHQALQQWPTPKGSTANGAGLHGRGSPDLQTVLTWWPTPQARDWKNGQASHETLQRNARPLAERLMQAEETTAGESRFLNADWVECLMGFPPGWSIPSSPPGRPSPRRSGSRPG